MLYDDRRSLVKRLIHISINPHSRLTLSKQIELDIESDWKVRSPSHPVPPKAELVTLQTQRIKESLEEKEGIPPAQQRLIFGGKAMYSPPSLSISSGIDEIWER